MALVKYGGGIVQASGSIAGTTHARNRYGNYIRSRTKPVNPNSTRQGMIRTALSFLAEFWHSGLSAGERIAWNTYAQSVSMKNRLGESIFLTGFSHFIRSNVERKAQALTVIEAGPTELALPEKDPTFAITASVATQDVTCVFDNALGWAGEVGGFLFIYMGVPQLVTRNYFGGPWKYMDRVVGAVVPPVSPLAADAAYTLVLGQKIWCYARVVRADGRVSEPFYASCTVAA